MTIDLGEGNMETIRVYENDDPYETAFNFCA